MTAREVAVEVLHRSRRSFASDALDEAFSRANLSAQDRRLTTQLVLGVTRRRATLDALIVPFVQRPPHAVEPRVWDVLQLGAYQLAFLTHIPPHAAVHESVELVRAVGSPMAKGFANGVLRRVAELVTPDYVDYAWTDTVPAEDGPNRYRKLAKDVLPDPEEYPGAYLAAACSWPRWLAERWLARHDFDECLRLGFWFNAAPPLWLRVNKLKGDRENYRLRLAAELLECEPGEHPQSLRLDSPCPVRDLPGYADGDFCIQDASSMSVAQALNPQPGMRILDLCAAPGGKATHLAELMDNRGRITACDVEASRLATVTTLAARLGIRVITTHLLAGDPPDGPFDAALVDVPCSNTGVLGRRPEVRWRLKPHEFEYLIRLQTKLLFEALARVKPGGAVVYSTCSIEPDENRNVVDAVRRGIRGLVVEAEHTSVPGLPADGGYWARIRKPG